MMTKVIYSVATNETLCMDAEPFTVTFKDEYKEFAEECLEYLRDEKPELLNGLLLSGELGNCLNCLAKIEEKLLSFYREMYLEMYAEEDEKGYRLDDDMLEYIEEEAKAEVGMLFILDDE